TSASLSSSSSTSPWARMHSSGFTFAKGCLSPREKTHLCSFLLFSDFKTATSESINMGQLQHSRGERLIFFYAFLSVPGPWAARNSSIDMGSLEVGRRVTQEVPPGVFWRSLMHLSQPQFLKFNISLGKDALFGVYIRKGLPPSHAQYDYMERLDGKEKWSVVESPRERRSIQTVVLNEAVFVQYLDPGTWHLAFYNDGKEKESVSFSTAVLDSVQECPRNCHGNGECVSGVCHCFPGFHGMDCSKAACPVLCSGNGQYDKGSCICYSGWKGPECDVPISQCIDPQCGSHGTCTEGTCVCSLGYKGENCAEVDCLDPTCSNNGICVNGECHCKPGWGGPSCELPRAQCPDQCHGHGAFIPDTGICSCDPNWMGPDCSVEVCSIDCGTHGVCMGGSCRCEEGWTGAACDQRVCNPLCVKHGTCKDGKCECEQGWNGEHCTIGRHAPTPDPGTDFFLLPILTRHNSTHPSKC
uniref:Teneurin transmembrane protein 2 n=1 Tax=Sinocyclocheilus grahami TaxID=75366 RepID=A0A672QE56_SINGR